ncbi:MAG: ABC transporter ATP-binding protein [Solirubrobacteraceae bacterium]
MTTEPVVNNGVAPPVLQVEQLRFRIGGVDIVAGVDIEVGAGELIGIIGPNGAGKTTLLNLLTGLIRPNQGRIHLRDRDITDLTPAARARLGMGRTFQTSLLFGSLTAFENARLAAQAKLGGNMRWWRRPRKDDEAVLKANDALAAVGMAQLAHQSAAGLSHGDKRKLELAILLASGADVLLLDEPMAGISHEEVSGLVDLIGRLHTAGHTVLMVEHHMAVVLSLADRLAVLHHGELLAFGDPASVTSNAVVQSAYLGETI